MSGYEVRAGRDHLEQFRKKNHVDALAELVWNGLDAEAGHVTVEVETSSILGDESTDHVSRIIVTDDGHGIAHERAVEAFPVLGDSWKRRLNGRTVNKTRILHGSKGRGRFYAYSLGQRVRWSTVFADESGQRWLYRIDGDRAALNRFEMSEPEETKLPTGTTVELWPDQKTPHRALLQEDYWLRLLGLLSSHLLATPDVTVRYRGRSLDPRPLMKHDPVEVVLDSIPAGELKGLDPPVLMIVEWADEVPIGSSLVLCAASGAGLAQADLERQPVKVTAYLKWAGFEHSSVDLTFADMAHSVVMDSARRELAQYVGARVEELKTHIVERLRQEDAYPYERPPVSATERAERDLYHHVVVTARRVLESGSKQHRQLTARLLKVALEERPEALEAILEKVLALPPDVRDDLAAFLTRSDLAALVRAGSEVTNRIDLLVALRRLLYESDEALAMREVDQLHPLVAGNEWLFGEEWILSRSETSLTNVIRACAPDTTILEEHLRANGGRITDADGKAGRVDLLLHRQFTGPSGTPERLVVELKRPSTQLGDAALSQIKRYARTLAEHQGVAPGHWTFWLLGSTMDDAAKAESRQRHREPGHVIDQDNYDVWVYCWGEVLDRAMRRYDVFRKQLDYEVSQTDAVARLKERYGNLSPPNNESTNNIESN